ncbi:MAG: helix-turn-helix domain-containing protein [Rhodobacteraceae bacterium]|nr:helix-turn-helix domain-containing protein [Paracoccaceae bacterium]
MEDIVLLTTKEVCSRLKVTRQTLYNWRNEGCPVYFSSKKTIRYDIISVMRWLRKRSDSK